MGVRGWAVIVAAGVLVGACGDDVSKNDQALCRWATTWQETQPGTPGVHVDEAGRRVDALVDHADDTTLNSLGNRMLAGRDTKDFTLQSDSFDALIRRCDALGQ